MRGTVDFVEDLSGGDRITPAHAGNSPARTRITPAHAGNSSRPAEFARREGDHPRACGEQFFIVNPPQKLMGSPPRMRGTEECMLAGLTHDRITPAHAGNSRCWSD